MSLINDALQRAKEVQQTHPSERGSLLEFRPVEPGPETKRSSAVFVVAIIALVMVFGVVFVLRQSSGSQSAAPTELQIAAKAPPTPQPAPPAAPAPAAISMVETPAPKSPPPKLQAIVFSSTRPSAIINGRTLYVGNRIGAYRVGAIQPNSATLVSDTETNVLRLGEE